MQFFIAIVPPEDIQKKIENIQRRFGDNTIEPHITVKTQGGLTEDMKWIEPVKSIAKKTIPFEIRLGSVMTFGNEVLYISVNSPGITSLHKDIMDSLDLPAEIVSEYYERELYTPHLTLGMIQTGFSSKDFPKMKELTENMLSETDVSFEAKFIRVYSMEPGEFGNYLSLEDIPFCG